MSWPGDVMRLGCLVTRLIRLVGAIEVSTLVVTLRVSGSLLSICMTVDIDLGGSRLRLRSGICVVTWARRRLCVMVLDSGSRGYRVLLV